MTYKLKETGSIFSLSGKLYIVYNIGYKAAIASLPCWSCPWFWHDSPCISLPRQFLLPYCGETNIQRVYHRHELPLHLLTHTADADSTHSRTQAHTNTHTHSFAHKSSSIHYSEERRHFRSWRSPASITLLVATRRPHYPLTAGHVMKTASAGKPGFKLARLQHMQ